MQEERLNKCREASDEDPGPVLFLLNALGIGGSERKTVNIVNELHSTGWHAHIAYLDNRIELIDAILPDVPVKNLERSGKLSLSSIRKLRAYILSAGIERIVCVGLYPLIYAQFATALLPSDHKPKVFLLTNTTRHARQRDRFNMAIYRPLMRRTRQIVFGCKVQQQLWCTQYHLEKHPSRVIYNGIDVDQFSPGAGADSASPAVRSGDNEFIVGAIGTLWPNKNHIELVSLLTHISDSVPNARLVIAGEGQQRNAILAAAASKGLAGRVRLLGEIPEVRPFLDEMDVFVLPSISETFSNAALEAMSMEKPVILSQTGGLPEMVEHGVDGFLYEQGNIDQLASIVLNLAADPVLRQTIGQQARQTVLERFTFARMADEYRELLRS